MFLHYQGQFYEFLFPSVNVWEFTTRRNHEIINREVIKSQAIPFKIEGRGAVGGYFLVYIPSEAKDAFAQQTMFDLIVHTSKRKKRFSLVANNHGRDAEQYGKKP